MSANGRTSRSINKKSEHLYRAQVHVYVKVYLSERSVRFESLLRFELKAFFRISSLSALNAMHASWLSELCGYILCIVLDIKTCRVDWLACAQNAADFANHRSL